LFVSATIAFHAHHLQKDSYSPNEPFIFSHVILNEGLGYNQTTGIFTAPVSGLYLFVKQTCGLPDRLLSTYFSLNNNALTKTLLGIEDYQTCASSQTIAQLSKGDTMFVTGSGTSSGLYTYSDSWPYFAGALINVNF